MRCHARTLRAYDDLLGRGASVRTPKPCFRCGADRADGDGEEGDSFRLVFGYGSRFDLEEWFVALCDTCCDEFAGWAAACGNAGVHRIGWDGKWRAGAPDPKTGDASCED